MKRVMNGVVTMYSGQYSRNQPRERIEQLRYQGTILTLKK
jgi:hypothetical protein